MSELNHHRMRIDQIDREISRLFEERLDLADAIGFYKAERGMPVYDPEREKEKLNHLRQDALDPGKAEDIVTLFEKIMEISRMREDRIIEKKHC